MHDSGASFSHDRVYRYKLWREWGTGPTIAFCMLNPSTANEAKNDATIERCQRRALAWGYGRLEIVNLFALRSTDPAMLYEEVEPTGGRHNDNAILSALVDADMMIAGWGVHGALFNRGAKVLDMMRPSGKVHVLKWTNAGHPGHPLYLPYTAQPICVAA